MPHGGYHGTIKMGGRVIQDSSGRPVSSGGSKKKKKIKEVTGGDARGNYLANQAFRQQQADERAMQAAMTNRASIKSMAGKGFINPADFKGGAARLPGESGEDYRKFMVGLRSLNTGAFDKAFPFSSGAAVGNIMKPLIGLASGGAGGIMNLLPNILSSVNKGLGGIFKKEKAPTDMGTSISSMDQADLDALKGPGMADISGESTSDGTFKTAEEAIAASGYPASEFAPLGITNPNLIQANSLLNFNDLLNFNPDNVDAQSIANAYKALTDNQGFDVQDNQLQYNQPLLGGNLQFGVGPDNAGIMFSKGLGA